MAHSEARGTILAGGLALIGGAVAFMGVFSYLAARFQYPEILDGKAQDVLPALLATGDAGRAVWAVYALLPLVFLPAGIGSFEALRERAAGPTRVGALFALVSSFSMMLGLMRWPSVHWTLARTWASAGEAQHTVLAAIFDGLNLYLGNFVGEFLGELSFSTFFILSGVGLLRHVTAPRWLGWWGVATGVLGLAGMWRNVTHAVNAIATANNYLLPAWMIGFGIWLVIASRKSGRSRESVVTPAA